MLKRKEAILAAETLTAEEMRNQIAQRAYQLYEARGRVEGYDVQDWLQAEDELLTQMGYAVEPVGAKAAARSAK
jgi:outer membrane protein TolC